MGAGDQRLGHCSAHLLLLGAVLATGHLGRDLVESGDQRRRAGLACVRYEPIGGAPGAEILDVGGLGDVLSGVLTVPLVHPLTLPLGCAGQALRAQAVVGRPLRCGVVPAGVPQRATTGTATIAE